MRSRIIGYLFDTTCGASVICIVSGITCLALYWWLGVFDSCSVVLFGVFALQTCMLVLELSVAMINLIRGCFRLGLLQLILFFAVSVMFCVALSFKNYAIIFSDRHAVEYRRIQTWHEVRLTNNVPFSVEFRSRHPIYHWYDSRVVFASGKRSGVMSGLHYPRAYDVIRLAPSVFSLMPMDVSTNHSCTYCVDVDKEAVWVRCGARLTAVPNESAGVVKHLDGSLMFNVRTDMIEVKDSPVPYGNDLNRLHCGAFEAPSAYEK